MTAITCVETPSVCGKVSGLRRLDRHVIGLRFFECVPPSQPAIYSTLHTHTPDSQRSTSFGLKARELLRI
jgi:hypothetical protein